jgi:hypothetical protein
VSLRAQLRARLDEARTQRAGAAHPSAVQPSAEPPASDHLRAVVAHNAAHPVADIVLITGRGGVRAADDYKSHLPDARIHLVSLQPLRDQPGRRSRSGVTAVHADDVEKIVQYLAGIAAPQVIVDLAPGPEKQLDRLAALLYLLDADGSYLVKTAADETVDTGMAAVLTQLTDTLTSDGRPPHVTRFRSWDAHLARSVSGVEQNGRLLMITPHGRHAVKLRDPQTTPALTARRGDSWGRQLASRPAVQFTPRTSVWTNRPAKKFRPVMTVPELYLREYRDVVCAQRGVAIAGDVMLPLSFNRLLVPQLRSVSDVAPNVSAWSVALDPALDDPPALAGVYYDLDSPYPWGFGHFMGEDMSRLWGWEQAKARHPGLKVLLSSASRRGDPPPNGRPKAHQLALLAAFGIGPDDIVCLDGPARVELLVGASRMWDNPHFVHPDITDIWDARREALRTPIADRPDTPRKIFVTRGHDMRRHCRNAVEVEALFASHDYEIVQPETLDIRGQVDVFAGAEAVAGFGGSAMFNMMHTQGPGRWIVIASSSYNARNEYLIAAARGGDYHHFVCDPIRPESPEEQAWGPLHWDYEFDFAHDGAALAALLTD